MLVIDLRVDLLDVIHFLCVRVLDKDFYIGLPVELNERVANVVNSKRYESFMDFLYSSLYKLNHLFRKRDLRSVALGYPKWMNVDVSSISYCYCFVCLVRLMKISEVVAFLLLRLQ